MLKLIVKKSSIHDTGLYADEDIPEDAEIIEYTGEKITTEEAEKREIENDKTGLTYIMILNNEYCIDGAVGGNDSKYANHSCDPNCYLVWKDDHVFIHAKKPIKKGEEITYDYAYDEGELVPCHCESTNCRKFINEP